MNDERLKQAARRNPIVNALARVHPDDFTLACESVVALIARTEELERILTDHICRIGPPIAVVKCR